MLLQAKECQDPPETGGTKSADPRAFGNSQATEQLNSRVSALGAMRGEESLWVSAPCSTVVEEQGHLGEGGGITLGEGWSMAYKPYHSRQVIWLFQASIPFPLQWSMAVRTPR